LNLVNCQAILNNTVQVKLTLDAKKRVFVIGDLDADLPKFERALASVNFNAANDILFALGDVIDRGAHSVALLQRFKELGVYMTLGNHEHMMLESVLAQNSGYHALWVENGGRWHYELSEAERMDVCLQLLNCPLSYLIEYAGMTIGLSHTVPQNWHWQNIPRNHSQAVTGLLWDRSITKQGKVLHNQGVDFSIHGHNSTPRPYWIGNTYHIDTNYLGGEPTLVELSSLISDFKQAQSMD